MRLPRDLDAPTLIKALARLGYAPVRQSGSHIRLHRQAVPVHTITVPNHSPLRVGTVSAILAEVARLHGLSRDQLLTALFEH